MDKIINKYLNLIYRNESKLPKYIKLDKVYHFMFCFLLSFSFGTHGVFASISASLTKEFSDSINPNSKWCWYDILADLLGILVGYPLGLIIFNGDYILKLLYNMLY